MSECENTVYGLCNKQMEKLTSGYGYRLSLVNIRTYDLGVNGRNLMNFQIDACHFAK